MCVFLLIAWKSFCLSFYICSVVCFFLLSSAWFVGLFSLNFCSFKHFQSIHLNESNRNAKRYHNDVENKQNGKEKEEKIKIKNQLAHKTS